MSERISGADVDERVVKIDEAWRDMCGSLPAGAHFTEGKLLESGVDYLSVVGGKEAKGHESATTYFFNQGTDLVGEIYEGLGKLVDGLAPRGLIKAQDINRKAEDIGDPRIVTARSALQKFLEKNPDSATDFDIQSPWLGFTFVGMHPGICELMKREGLGSGQVAALGVGVTALKHLPEDTRLGFAVLSRQGGEKAFSLQN